MAQLIDEQQSLIKEFEKLYERCSKEPTARRTHENVKLYEDERLRLWEIITKNDKALKDAGAPKEYLSISEKIETKNGTFTQMLSEWSKKGKQQQSESSDEQYDDPQASTSKEPNLNYLFAKFLTTMSDHQSRQRAESFKIEIPLFDGELNKYKLFKDSIEESVKDSQ